MYIGNHTYYDSLQQLKSLSLLSCGQWSGSSPLLWIAESASGNDPVYSYIIDSETEILKVLLYLFMHIHTHTCAY